MLPRSYAVKGLMQRVVRMFEKFSVLVSLVLIAAVLSGCAVNPVTGQRELVVVSDQQAIAIGTQQYAQAQQMQGGRYSTDAALGEYVNRVGQKLARYSGADLPYEFVVLNHSVPNAWALPGGKIAINRGLLVELRNEAELAAVLAHEIVHAAARHGAKRIERSMLTQGAVAITAITTAGTQYGDLASQLAQGGSLLINQKYSRDAERESDYYGTRIMAQAGYDPHGAVTLQETFVSLSGAKQQAFIDGLLASHPASTERVNNNRGLVKQLRAEGFTGGAFNQAEYAAATRSLRQSQGAYDAYDVARQAVNDGKLDEALREVNRAIDAYPQEALFHSLRGTIRMRQERWDDAVTNFDRAIERDRGYFAHYLQRGLGHYKLKHNDQAQRDLDQSVRLLPTAVAYNALGQLAEARGDTQAAQRYYQQASGSQDASGQAARSRLVALQINDQPGKFVRAQVQTDAGGRVWVQAANLTDIGLRDVVIRVELQTAAGARTDTIRFAAIKARAAARAEVSGDTAGVVGARAYAVAAKTAQ